MKPTDKDALWLLLFGVCWIVRVAVNKGNPILYAKQAADDIIADPDVLGRLNAVDKDRS